MARGRVVLVEDTSIVGMLFEAALEDAGFQVRSLSPPEAVTEIRRSPPDAVLTEIMLKGRTDGYGVAEAAKRMGVPTLFIATVPPDPVKARDLAVGHILKPSSLDLVCRVTAAIVDRQPVDLPADAGEIYLSKEGTRH